MLDLLIRNALVADGTGQPATRRSVGIRGDRIVLTAGDESARRTIDADGLMLAPGFMDIHTHYDAQLGWDSSASPSLSHGTTTVMGGNCGFSIAPLRPDMADYMMRMLSVVEGIPLVSLQDALGWDWGSFDDWLRQLDGRIAINAGFFAGHSALRTAAMGEAALGEPASPAQIEDMQRLLRESLAAGAFGFSTTTSTNHLDARGRPVPSRYASPEELIALASTLKAFEGTSLQITPDGFAKGFRPEEIDLMAGMSLASGGRAVNWNALIQKPEDPDFVMRQLEASTQAARQGARIVSLCLPIEMHMRYCLGTGMPFNGLPGWGETFALDIEPRMRALSDPAVRQQLRKVEQLTNLGSRQSVVRWGDYRVIEGVSPAAKALEEKTIREIARARGGDPFDVLLDICIADKLGTALAPWSPVADEAAWKQRVALWRDPRVVLGGSDAGAHLDMFCNANYPTRMLAEAVRERGLLSFEEAVHLLSDVPARFYGLKRRGRIADGWFADMVLFDPATIDSGDARVIADLPAGASRVLAEPVGIRHVFVNGAIACTDGRPTQELRGTVLRAGKDSGDDTQIS